MPAFEPDPLAEEFSPRTLYPGEEVLRRWASPGGRGLLTNLRCLLLSHPHPLHRLLRWTINLEEVSSLSVEVARAWSFFGEPDHGPFGGGEIEWNGISTDHAVLVNQVAVYIGVPQTCADVQQWVDDARTARCLVLYGRLRPYQPPLTPREDASLPSPTAAAPVDVAIPAPVQASTAPEYLLFIAGVPYRDVGPSKFAGTTLYSGGVGVFVPNAPHGHEPADFRSGQVYGWQAEVGRMVLHIAGQLGVAVRVVDVDHAGPDLDLVQRYVRPDGDLPILLRPDGHRLEGEDAFVPVRVEQFLRGQ